MMGKYLAKIAQKAMMPYFDSAYDISVKLNLTYDKMSELEAKLEEIIEKIQPSKVTQMMNEMKGVVSMARAALDEGKQFSASVKMTKDLQECIKEIMKNKRGSKRKSCQ